MSVEVMKEDTDLRRHDEHSMKSANSAGPRIDEWWLQRTRAATERCRYSENTGTRSIQNPAKISIRQGARCGGEAEPGQYRRGPTQLCGGTPFATLASSASLCDDRLQNTTLGLKFYVSSPAPSAFGAPWATIHQFQSCRRRTTALLSGPLTSKKRTFSTTLPKGTISCQS